MKRVSYGGGSILTGDKIADALLDYAAALARADSADHLRVPSVGADGARAEIDIVVGPASQLLAEREDMPGDDIEDQRFIDDLAYRGRLAAAGRADQIGRAGEA